MDEKAVKLQEIVTMVKKKKKKKNATFGNGRKWIIHLWIRCISYLLINFISRCSLRDNSHLTFRIIVYRNYRAPF